MNEFKEILERIGRRMQELDIIREKALTLSREIIVNCRKSIQSIHRRDFENAMKLLRGAGRKLKSVYRLIEDYPELTNLGFIENAAQEFVEAKCLYHLEKRKKLPDPEKLGVSYITYLLGLCDLVGELRRFSLDSMKNGDVDRADYYLKLMENIHESLMEFEYPPSLKRKQDIARGLIEKTKSELTVASCEKRINDKIEEFRGILDKIEKGKIGENKKQKEKDIDIDLDRLW